MSDERGASERGADELRDLDLSDLDLERFFAAHREPSDTPDVMAILRRRTPARHRARRRGLQTIQAQHLHDGNALFR